MRGRGAKCLKLHVRQKGPFMRGQLYEKDRLCVDNSRIWRPSKPSGIMALMLSQRPHAAQFSAGQGTSNRIILEASRLRIQLFFTGS